MVNFNNKDVFLLSVKKITKTGHVLKNKVTVIDDFSRIQKQYRKTGRHFTRQTNRSLPAASSL
jgi:hypothetical protein